MKPHSLAILVLLSLVSTAATSEESESETPTLDKLRAKHDIDNPDRNFRDLDSLELIPGDSEGDTRTEDLIDGYFESGIDDGRTLDYSQYVDGVDSNALRSESANWALDGASSMGMPTMNEDQSIKFEYSENGTQAYKLQEDGSYEFVSQDGGSRRTSGLQMKDVYGNEVNNEDHERFDGVKSSYGNERQLFEQGSNNLQQLRNQSNLTSDAVGYRTILGSQERALETELNEDFLQGSRDRLKEVQTDPSDLFTACRTTQKTRTVGSTGNIKGEHFCQDIDRNNYNFCELRRDILVEERVTTSQAVMCEPEEQRFCGTTTHNCWLCYTYDTGSTWVHTEERHSNPHFGLCSSDDEDLGFGCIEESTWREVEDEDEGIQAMAYPAQTQGDVGLHDNGGYSGRYRVTENIIQYPDNCLDKATPEEDEDKFCTFEGYEIIEESTRGFNESIIDLIGPLFPGDTGEVSWRANLENYACEPFEGEELCFTPQGENEELCKSWYDWFGRHDQDVSEMPDEQASLIDQCSVYRNDPSCERIDSECAEGMMDGDICRISNVRYECSDGVGGTRQIIVDENTCDAMIPCAGGECDNTNDEVNQDFNKAALQASVLHEVNNDNGCIDEDGNADDCEIFQGFHGTCARGTGLAGAVELGGPDCCDDPTAPSVQDYITAMRTVAQFETVRNTASWAATPVKGGYDKIADGASSAWGKVTSAFTSNAESAGGTAAGTTAAGDSFMDQGMEKLTEATMKWMGDNLPEGITHSIFATSERMVDGERVLEFTDDPPQWSESIQQIGNFANTLMTAYSYYTTAKLIMDIAFQCQEDETEVSGARTQLQCVYLGSGDCKLQTVVGGCVRRDYHYCCFNSLLARIIMEQASEQLDRPLGRDQACRGLTPAELAELDWSQIDLESEWLPLMYESGYIVAETDEETLTGDGRFINSGARQVVSERTKERFNNISDDDVKDMKEEMKHVLDCSVYPRPPRCEYQ